MTWRRNTVAVAMSVGLITGAFCVNGCAAGGKPWKNKAAVSNAKVASGEKNEVTNGDLSQMDANGQLVNWRFTAVDGHPTYRVVNDEEGARMAIDLAAGDGARLSQGLKQLPPLHYYAFNCEYRLTSKHSMSPNIAIRISAGTKKGLWRIWDLSKPDTGEWLPLHLDFVVPSDITGKGVALTYYVNDNRMPGTIELRNVKVVELPLTQYQRDNAYTAVDGDVFFPKQTASPPPNSAFPVSAVDKPLFWWTGRAGDGILNSEAPDAKLINQPVILPVAGGGDKGRVLLLEANKALKDISVHLDGVPSSMTATLQRVDVWRQRLGYRGGFYEFLPERLLDLPKVLDMAAGQRLQLFLRLKAGESAKPGAYPLTISIRQNDKTIFRVPVTVQVEPFVLPANAPQPVWGLYPDSGRWNGMTPAAMDTELKWLHDCGIRTLLLYMPLDAVASPEPLSDKNLDEALTRWRNALNKWGDRYMDHFIKAGFGPVWVCNLQSLPPNLAKAAGLKIMDEENQKGTFNPQLLRYIKAYISVVEEVRQQRHWPEFYYHLVDEPGGGVNTAALAQFSVLQDLKVKGYTTANQAAVVRDFRNFLNIFAISNGVITSPEELKRNQNWISAYPDAQQWWYGAAGSYSLQDGNLRSNRFGMGFYTWLTGAKGGFLWTYQRISGSPFDDFDGAAKDAAMTYPPEDPAERSAGKTVSTLQWEGMREGMTDYRYLQLLDSLLQKKAHSGNANTGKIADEVNALRATIWKDPTGGIFSNRNMDEWRAQVAKWIVELERVN